MANSSETYDSDTYNTYDSDTYNTYDSDNDTYYRDYTDPDFNQTINKQEFSMHNSENKREYLYQEPSQMLIRNFISKNTIYENVLLYHSVGVGKCHKKDTPILMYNGQIKKVQDIKVGDYLMGDDSTPRKVLSLATGEDMMYDIIPSKGDKYTVNKEHILCLKVSGYPNITHSNCNFNVQWVQNNKYKQKTFTYDKNNEKDKAEKQTAANNLLKSITDEQIIEISVKDYLKLSKATKRNLKGYKSEVNFPSKKVPSDPYTLGYSLGNGKNGNKFLDYIPFIYKCNDRQTRLKILAGILDADGHCTRGLFELTQPIKNQKLIDDIIYLARSLGFGCYKQARSSDFGCYLGCSKKVYNICIYGKGVEEIPTKKLSVGKQTKNALFTGITVKEVGIDKYWGFTLDGNSRYLMGDFTVTHNTCAAITIAEGLKEYVHNMGKKIFVLVKNKNIQKNFTDELLSKCTGDEYLETDAESDNAGAKKEISKFYQFMTYGTFVNKVLGIKEFIKDEFGRNTKRVKRINGVVQRKSVQDAIRTLNNTVIIVDEVHNITNNDAYSALMQVLSQSFNYRLVLLTATPIYDNPKEIFEISNLLNVGEQRLQLPIRDKLFEGQTPLLVKEKSKYINGRALKGGIIKITDAGLTYLSKSLYGKVSYLKANTETNPQSSVIGEQLIPNRLGTTNVVYCEMSPYQYRVYLNALKTDLHKDSKFDISSAIQQIESEENIIENEVLSKTSSLYKNTSDASTMSYPLNQWGKTGFLNIFTKSGSSFVLKKEYADVLTSRLNEYSSKLYTLLQNINKTETGNIFIYTNYVSYGGTSLLKQLLLANGFSEFTNKKSCKHYKSFIVFDESTNILRRERFKQIFNSEDNKDGKYIRIIIGSPIISEGITLKCVRQVHILEPYWNMSKINQIVGRAIRNFSHHYLPESERTVDIYKYVSVYNKTFEGDIRTSKLENFFIDYEKYILSEEKDRSNKQVEKRLKSLSFDCFLNYKRNKISSEYNGLQECDYKDCEYKCLVQPKDTIVDKSTYDMYISFFEQFDIHFVLQVIRDLFKKYFVWSLSDIISKVKHLEPLVTKETIYTTLNYIVQDRVNMVDKYDREGFIINKGPYYIFNESNLEIKNTIYSKILDFSVNQNKYTINEFAQKYFNINLFKEKERDKAEKQKGEISQENIQKNLLSAEDLEYNKNIEDTWDIYGTYRAKKTKSDKWDHKYGALDNKFRLNIKSYANSDQRKVTTGKWIGSYNIKELKDIAKKLGIKVIESWQKEDLGEKIQQFLNAQNRTLK